MILLHILKWFGIVLLSILGLILLVVLLVLLVPVRYQIRGSFYQRQPAGTARISWLFHFLHMTLRYQEGRLPLVIRIAGIPVIRKEFLKKSQETEPTPEPESELTPEPESGSTPKLESGTTPKPGSEPTPESELAPKSEPDLKSESETKQESEPKREIKSDQAPGTESRPEPETGDRSGPGSPGDPLSLSDRVEAFFNKILQGIQEFLEKITGIQETISGYYRIFTRKATGRGIGLVKRSVGRVLRSVAPRKFRVNLHLGFPDKPALMGQLSMAAGILYPFLEGHGGVQLDFEEECLEGDFFLRGRIIPVIPAYLALRVWFDKDIRKVRYWLKRQKMHGNDKDRRK